LIDKSGIEKKSEKDGATIYEDDGGEEFGVKDDVLIVGGSQEEIEQALERRSSDSHYSEADFDSSQEGLAGQALVRASFNIQALLRADPSTAGARKVEYVDAIRTLGLAATTRRDGVELGFNLKTDSDGLSEGDLPIASGSDSPDVVDEADSVNVGLRNPKQVTDFAQATAQAIDPSGFGDFERAKQTIAAGLGVDLDDDIMGQARDVAVSINPRTGRFGARASLKDPAAFEKSLERASRVLPQIARGAGFDGARLVEPRRGSPFYALVARGGGAIVFGVVERNFILANDADKARAVAEKAPERVPGAKGALAVKARGQTIANAIIPLVLGGVGLEDLGISFEGLLGALGDVTGSAESSTSGVKGSLKAAVD
jgi:hypothetical protein